MTRQDPAITISDFKGLSSAYLIFFPKRNIRGMADSFLREVDIKSVGKKYVDIVGDKYVDRFAVNTSEPYLTCYCDGKFDDSFVLFPTLASAQMYLEYMKLRYWFIIDVNWSYAGKHGIDSMSFSQLKAITAILNNDVNDFWVPCSERPPAVYDFPYMVTVRTGSSVSVKQGVFSKDEQWIINGQIDDGSVIAWRDIPLPYSDE